MKKFLLAGTALAGAVSLNASLSYADAPVMTFSGGLAYEMIWSGGDQQDAGTGFNISADEQQSVFVWDARATADNGISYGANIAWQWADGGTVAGAGAAGTFDEAWVDFSGGFGRIFLGGEDGVEDLVSGTAAHNVTGGPGGTDGNNALRHVNFLGMNTVLLYYNSASHFSSDNNKIGYVTPNFGGFTAGVSFMPNGTFLQQQGLDNQALDEALSFAAGWQGEIEGVQLAIDGSYGIGEDNAGTNGAEQQDIGAYHLGALVGFAGFSLAGSYVNNDDSGCPTATVNCDAGDGWNIGIGYNFGPGAVSLTYQTAEDDTDGNGQADEADIIYADVSYTVAEGLSTYLSGYWFDLENESGSGVATNSNDATVVILGTRVTF